jgi:hypothetical protein
MLHDLGTMTLDDGALISSSSSSSHMPLQNRHAGHTRDNGVIPVAYLRSTSPPELPANDFTLALTRNQLALSGWSPTITWLVTLKAVVDPAVRSLSTTHHPSGTDLNRG